MTPAGWTMLIGCWSLTLGFCVYFVGLALRHPQEME